jgi:sulfatase maturation enzyme AslB (radical SAM superfamily)
MDLTKYKNCFAHKNAIYISNEDNPSKPCCFYKHGVTAATKQEYIEKILATDIETGCSHCIQAEENGAEWSHRRQYENDWYTRENVKVFVLGVCFDNICNLKCTTCGPLHSSKWIEDYTKMNRWTEAYPRQKYTRLMNEAPAKIKLVKDAILNQEFDIIKLEIFGGEPTISPDIMELIEWLSELPIANKVVLSLITNGTTMIDKLSHYLNKFNEVSIQVSIDGTHDVFEYLRYGAKWEQVEHNVIAYHDISLASHNFRFGIHYTLSWMNSDHFTKYVAWLVNTFNQSNKVHVYLTKLEGPRHYSVDMLNPEVKEQILNNSLKEIDKLNLTNTEWQSLVYYYSEAMKNYSVDLYADPVPNATAKRELAQLDKIRNTNYTSTFLISNTL